MNFTKFQDSSQVSSVTFTCSEDASRVAAFLKTFNLVKKEKVELGSNKFYENIDGGAND
jgi:hypothetical protein